MSTTQLYVELIIIGLETCVWIIFTAFSITNLGFIQHAGKLVSTVPLSISLIGIFYIVGILVDRFSDLVFEPLNKKIRERYVIQSESIYLIYKNSGFENYFNYSRSRIRIFRASVINLPLITLSIIAFIFRYYLSKGLYLLFFVFTLGTVASIIAIIFFKKILHEYYNKAKRMEQSK